MMWNSSSLDLPRQDLVFGASVYFLPLFKVAMPGFLLWYIAHRLLREWIYSGEIWHSILLDISLFVTVRCDE
ncbi:DUF1656 domain-containing protein [Kosakonia oryziphila]|uniref:DUF1656 domain-containing protein n=1 Tax=Kosakonia oryziphila TaxID=1005667 RepID=A0A1C4FAS3_9ENTR|nr:DUF1656 domain-containing protein [Kosakonia oryziphila]SCC52611.1 Protein of unknown function [Kosakonia oryziphila]